MSGELTGAQFLWLATLAGDRVNGLTMAEVSSRNGTYNPRSINQRTFDALERKGLAEWHCGADANDGPNGYRITDAGRAALSAQEDKAGGRA